MADGQSDYKIRITAEQTAAFNQATRRTKEEIKSLSDAQRRANTREAHAQGELDKSTGKLTSKKKLLTDAMRGVNTQASRMGQVMGALVSPISIAFTLITAVALKARRDWQSFWEVMSDTGRTEVSLRTMEAYKKSTDEAAESTRNFRKELDSLRTAQEKLSDVVNRAEKEQQQRFQDEEETASQRLELGLAGVTAAEAAGQISPAQAARQRESLRASFGKAQIDIRSRARQASISSRRGTISTLGEAESALTSRLAGVDKDLTGIMNPAVLEASLKTAKEDLEDAKRRQVNDREKMAATATPGAIWQTLEGLGAYGIGLPQILMGYRKWKLRQLESKDASTFHEIATRNAQVVGLQRRIAETTAEREPLLGRQKRLQGELTDIVTQRTALQRGLPGFEASSAADIERLRTGIGVTSATRLADGEAAARAASSQASSQAVQDLRQGIRSSTAQEAAEWSGLAQEFREYQRQILQRMSEFRREISDTKNHLKNQRNQ